MDKELYQWQEECLRNWTKNEYRGIVNVVTGAGKTILALGAIEMLQKHLPEAEGRAQLKVKIVVPKVFLANQWMDALRNELSIPSEQVGGYHGTRKDNIDRKYMVYVINSARYTLARHILNDVKNGCKILLIADECHHYAAKENAGIFDFIEHLPDSACYYSLGLSATPYNLSSQNQLSMTLGPEIFKYGFAHALESEIISKFYIFNIKLQFDLIEQEQYLELTDKITILLRKLMGFCPYLRRLQQGQFYAELNRLENAHENREIRELARTLSYLFYERKAVVYSARSRISCVVQLVMMLPKKFKIIIFGERIEMAEVLYERIKEFIPNDVGIYHSGIDNMQKKLTLRKYRDSEIRVLISCRALDEGLNVPETDVGILVSSANSSRQRIQRLGRILRKKTSGNIARLYYLFVDGTAEENDMLSGIADGLEYRFQTISMEYEQNAQVFISERYDFLVSEVLAYIQNGEWDPEQIAEVRRNLELGRINCEWLSGEEECERMIQSADAKELRNYYIAMLLLIRARLGK